MGSMKRNRKTDKAREAKRKRQARRKDDWISRLDSYPIGYVGVVPETEEERAIAAPFRPSSILLSSDGRDEHALPKSPWRSLVEVPEEDPDVSPEALTLFIKWPFLAATAGKPVPEEITSLATQAWCLSKLSGEDFDTVLARVVDNLNAMESCNLVLWSEDGNVAVFSDELPDDAEGMNAFAAWFNQASDEELARLRDRQVTVEATPRP